MNFDINPPFIIGALLIVWGVSILTRIIFGIELPIFKSVLAALLIYLGLTFIFGNNKNSSFDLSYTSNNKKDEVQSEIKNS